MHFKCTICRKHGYLWRELGSIRVTKCGHVLHRDCLVPHIGLGTKSMTECPAPLCKKKIKQVTIIQIDLTLIETQRINQANFMPVDCVLCHDSMKDPKNIAVTKCGHIYHHVCLAALVRPKSNDCLVSSCKLKLTPATITQIMDLNDVKSSQPLCKDEPHSSPENKSQFQKDGHPVKQDLERKCSTTLPGEDKDQNEITQSQDVAELKRQYKALEEQMEVLKKERNDAKKETAIWEMSFQYLQDSFKDTEMMIPNEKTLRTIKDNETLKLNVQELERERNDAKKETAVWEMSFLYLQNTFKGTEIMIPNEKTLELIKENENLKISVQDLQRDLNSLEENMKKLDSNILDLVLSHSQENDTLKELNVSLLRENTSLNELKENMQKEEIKLHEINNTLQEENKKLHDLNNSLQKESKTLHELNNTLQTDNNQLHKFKDTLLEENDELHGHNDTLLKENNKLIGLDDIVQKENNKSLGLDDTVQKENNKLLGLDDTVQKENNKSLGLDDTVQKENNKLLGLDDTVQKENNKSLGLDDTVQKENNKSLGLDDTVQKENNKLLRLDDTVQKENNKSLGLDDTVQKENNKSLGLDDTVREENNKLLGLDDTVQEENNKLPGLDDTVQKKNNKLLGLDDTVQEENNKLLGLDGTVQKENNKLHENNDTLQEENKKLNELVSSLQKEKRDFQWGQINRCRSYTEGVQVSDKRKSLEISIDTKEKEVVNENVKKDISIEDVVNENVVNRIDEDGEPVTKRIKVEDKSATENCAGLSSSMRIDEAINKIDDLDQDGIKTERN